MVAGLDSSSTEPLCAELPAHHVDLLDEREPSWPGAGAQTHDAAHYLGHPLETARAPAMGITDLNW